MVILFRGTYRSRNNAPQSLALFAGMTVVKYARKTLILQMASRYSVEEYLMGKQMRDQIIKNEMNMFDDVGIDALLRRVETQKLDARHFSSFCQELYAEPNMFDMAFKSKKDDFEEEILSREKDVARLIEQAKEIYDDIYILIDGKNEKLSEMMNNLVDIVFVCVPQGHHEDFPTNSEKTRILVTNFDSRSSYDLKSMGKRYSVGEIAHIPFNIMYRDYCFSQNLIRFIMTNDKVGPDDDNYDIIDSVCTIIEKIHDGKLLEIEEPMFERKAGTRKAVTHSKAFYTGKNVQITTETKGFFRKRQHTFVEFSEDAFLENLQQNIYDEVAAQMADSPQKYPSKGLSRHKKQKKRRLLGHNKKIPGAETEQLDSASATSTALETSDSEYNTEDYAEFVDPDETLIDDVLNDSTEELEEDNSDYYAEDDFDYEDGSEETNEDDLGEYTEGEPDEENFEDAEYYEKEVAEDSESDEETANVLEEQEKRYEDIKKYCEDRKFMLSETDMQVIQSKSFVKQRFHEWKTAYVTELWKEFCSIPINQSKEITLNWGQFPAGSDVKMIKNWFVFNYGNDIMENLLQQENPKTDSPAVITNGNNSVKPTAKRIMKGV